MQFKAFFRSKMEARLHDNQIDKNEERVAQDNDVVVDINSMIRSTNNESSKEEQVCRICHFGKEDSSGGSEIILLGCDCRGELGVSHASCAQAWFSQKGNRLCEICGKTAKNIISNTEEETSIFMMEWNEMRMVAATLDTSDNSSRRCKKSFCNVVLGCLVVAFVVPWFFHGTDIL